MCIQCPGEGTCSYGRNKAGKQAPWQEGGGRAHVENVSVSSGFVTSCRRGSS